jgi:hypothetical protein
MTLFVVWARDGSPGFHARKAGVSTVILSHRAVAGTSEFAGRR